MANCSDQAASSRCLSTVLRILSCSGSLPTHPSDQFLTANENPSDLEKFEKSSKSGTDDDIQLGLCASATTPSLVARLMGLDSLPVASTLPVKSRTLGSYFRSKSLGSNDFALQIDLNTRCQHRRAGSAVSFLEMSCLLQNRFDVVFPPDKAKPTATFQENLPEKNAARGHCRYEQAQSGRTGKSGDSKKVNKEIETGKLKGSSKKMESNREINRKLHEKKTTTKPVESRGRTRNKKGADLVKEASLSGSLGVYKQKGTKTSNSRRTNSSYLAKDKAMATQRLHSRRTNSSYRDKDKALATQIPHSGPLSSYRGKDKAGNETNRLLMFRENENEICSDWANLKFEEIEEISFQFEQQILDLLLHQVVGEMVLCGLRN